MRCRWQLYTNSLAIVLSKINHLHLKPSLSFKYFVKYFFTKQLEYVDKKCYCLMSNIKANNSVISNFPNSALHSFFYHGQLPINNLYIACYFLSLQLLDIKDTVKKWQLYFTPTSQAIICFRARTTIQIEVQPM